MTCVCVPYSAVGITVRPLLSLSGIHHSSESFYLVRSMATEWQPGCMIPQNPPVLESVGAGPDRVLQHTSGNAQSYTDHIENGHVTCGEDQLQQLAYKYPQPTHPLPHTVSAPNLSQQALAARLQQKKLRRLQSAGPPLPTTTGPRKRSYLKSQKYLEYRARPRRDTGKDGEPVWSDALEDAFQQGWTSPHSCH